MEHVFKGIEEFIRDKYHTQDGFIALHEPRFRGNEKKYINDCIDTSFVSSVGKYVDIFEQMLSKFTGSKYAVAAVNGTSALHIALLLSDVKPGDEVITQALTFIATANAISYTGAKHIFIDVDRNTLGLSPTALEKFLSENTIMENGYCMNRISGHRIKACVPMHTFGHPCKIDEIVSICNLHNIDVVEDSAESLGSTFKGKHTGTFGKLAISSFNGNKTITTGGGGMIFTQSEKLGRLAKHITTTAKLPHQWEFNHDMIGYNYRLTNLAAAIGCAQMEELPYFILKKRELAHEYSQFFRNTGINFFEEPENSSSNYWLNTLIFDCKTTRQKFLEYMSDHKIMTRPAWTLMNKLPMYDQCQCGSLENTEWLADRIANIPSSVI